MNDERFLEWFRTAAPYFNAHRGRHIVIYVDGRLLAAAELAEFVHDIALLHSLGVRMVLVPGVRPQVAALLGESGEAETFVDAVRVTSATAMQALRQAVGELSVELQARLSMGLANSPMHGARIRVCSGNFVTARPHGIHEGVDYGYTGQVRRVDTETIKRNLEMESVVLVPPIGYSPTGEVFNVLATELAAHLSVELRAHKLILLSPGGMLRRDGRRVGNLSLSEARAWFEEPENEMGDDERKRFEAALYACRNGVPRAHLLDACHPGAMAMEMYTRDGAGTMLNADDYHAVRRARLDDIGGILELIEPLEKAGQLVRRSRMDIERTIDQYFVDERDGTVVACAAAHPFAEASAVELACLAVHEGYRGTGRGDRMLSWVESEAARVGAKNLFVLTTRANHWFRERGFQEADIGELPVARRTLYNDQRASQVLVKTI